MCCTLTHTIAGLNNCPQSIITQSLLMDFCLTGGRCCLAEEGEEEDAAAPGTWILTLFSSKWAIPAAAAAAAAADPEDPDEMDDPADDPVVDPDARVAILRLCSVTTTGGAV